jgi:hypothetical protein
MPMGLPTAHGQGELHEPAPSGTEQRAYGAQHQK